MNSLDLDPEQSAQLTAATNGDWSTVFAVIGRETYPGDPKRWRLWIIPTTGPKANRAVRIVRERPTDR